MPAVIGQAARLLFPVYHLPEQPRSASICENFAQRKKQNLIVSFWQAFSIVTNDPIFSHVIAVVTVNNIDSTNSTVAFYT